MNEIWEVVNNHYKILSVIKKKMFQILKVKKKVNVDDYFKLGHVTWTIDDQIGPNNHVT